jgi:hypothetical protein
MNQQGASIAVMVCGLRAGRIMKEIMSYGNINKSTVYEVEKSLKKFSSGGFAEAILTGRKGTVLAANLDELIIGDLGRSPPLPHPDAGDEHFQNKYERIVSKDALNSCKSPLHLPAGRHSCPRQQRDAELAQG